MREITLKLYSFNELSEEVQEKVIDDLRFEIMGHNMNCFSSEYKNVLDKFEMLTNSDPGNWEVGYNRCHFRTTCESKDIYYDYDLDESVMLSDLCGKHLFRYILHEIIPYITKGKYFSVGKSVNEKYTYKARYSKVLKENPIHSCPLTGMVYDGDILEPIVKYYENWTKYDENFTYEDLMDQCYEKFFITWKNEYEYWSSDEGVRSELTDSYDHLLFHEDGEKYTGRLS